MVREQNIGLSKDLQFENHQVILEHGDKLFLFTDGIIEAQNPDKEQYRKKRLIDFVVKNRKMPLSKLSNNIINEVLNHADNQPIRDDLTLLGIEIK